MSKSFTFQLIAAHGTAPFHPGRLDDLESALKARIPGCSVEFDGRLSEANPPRRPYLTPEEVPSVDRLTVHAGGLSREAVRADVQATLNDIGLSNISPAND